MTEFRQLLTDLQPGKNYVVKATVTDNNLGTVVGETSVVMSTPPDATIPEGIAPASFFLFSNSKSVMFRFDAVADLDVSGYDYELYAENSTSSTLLASRKKLHDGVHRGIEQQRNRSDRS